VKSVVKKNSESIWTVPPPTTQEKAHGKHPTQKPVALIERCLLAATDAGDLVLDPFLGNGTTAVAAARLRRRCVGIKLDLSHLQIAAKRVDANVIEIWLREFRVNVTVVGQALRLSQDRRSACHSNGRQAERLPYKK